MQINACDKLVMLIEACSANAYGVNDTKKLQVDK